MSNWISVNGAYPEINVDVLITDGKSCAVAFNSYSFGAMDNGWEPAESVDVTYDMAYPCLDMNKITHWMPLPKLPD